MAPTSRAASRLSARSSPRLPTPARNRCWPASRTEIARLTGKISPSQEGRAARKRSPPLCLRTPGGFETRPYRSPGPGELQCLPCVAAFCRRPRAESAAQVDDLSDVITVVRYELENHRADGGCVPFMARVRGGSLLHPD